MEYIVIILATPLFILGSVFIGIFRSFGMPIYICILFLILIRLHIRQPFFSLLNLIKTILVFVPLIVLKALSLLSESTLGFGNQVMEPLAVFSFFIIVSLLYVHIFSKENKVKNKVCYLFNPVFLSIIFAMMCRFFMPLIGK